MSKLGNRFDLGAAVVAGVVAGVCLIGFEMVAMAGWTWFPENPHHTIAFLGAVVFGGVLGGTLGRLRVMVLRGA